MRIAERHREGLADWLDCLDLLCWPEDPADVRDLGRNRTDAPVAPIIGPNADLLGDPSSGASGSSEPALEGLR
jgi:hypothetical protein